MADLIERSAAIDALEERPTTWVGGDYELGKQDQYDRDLLAIEAVPAADAVPVVRCKDCIRFDERRGCNLVEGLNMAKPDSHCSYAERRTDG